MFSEINGLPVHPLAVHAVVVLVPLAALLGVLFAVPRTRAWARVPLLLVSLAAVVTTYVARESGKKFEEALDLGGPIAALVEEHSERADLLWYLVLGFAAVAVLAFIVTWSSNANSLLVFALSAVLVVGAVGLGVQVYRVGEIGSKAVWNPTGDADFSE